MDAFSAVERPSGRSGPGPGRRTAVPAGAVFEGVVPAGARAALAVPINLAAVALCALAGWPAGAAAAVLLGLAALVALGVDAARTGRTPGHRLLGLRTVDAAAGLPVGLAALLPGGGLTADLRHGRDPLRLVPAPGPATMPAATVPRSALPTGPGPAPAGNPWDTVGGVRSTGLLLLTDEGAALAVLGPTVIGRNPVDGSGKYQLLSVPDLSRVISRTHALLEPEAAGVWVTDLGSTGGTDLARPGEQQFQPLPPGTRVHLPVGSRLSLGGRVLQLISRGGAGARP